jgi:hypothetical protein
MCGGLGLDSEDSAEIIFSEEDRSAMGRPEARGWCPRCLLGGPGAIR